MPIPPDWYQQLSDFVEAWKRNSTEECVGDNPFPKFVLTEQAASWNDFLEWVNELHGSWCFRGQREAEWSLSTSLDRDVKRPSSFEYPDGIKVTGYYHLDRDEEGNKNLFRFREQARRQSLNIPSDRDRGSWFALMQHYGTRHDFWTGQARHL